MQTLQFTPEGKRAWSKIMGPDYVKRRKLTFFLSVTDKEIVADDSYWSDGSKSHYFIVNKNGAVIRSMREIPPPPFSDGNYDRHMLNDDEAIVRIGWFCGKVATPHIYVKNVNGWRF